MQVLLPSCQDDCDHQEALLLPSCQEDCDHHEALLLLPSCQDDCDHQVSLVSVSLRCEDPDREDEDDEPKDLSLRC